MRSSQADASSGVRSPLSFLASRPLRDDDEGSNKIDIPASGSADILRCESVRSVSSALILSWISFRIALTPVSLPVSSQVLHTWHFPHRPLSVFNEFCGSRQLGHLRILAGPLQPLNGRAFIMLDHRTLPFLSHPVFPTTLFSLCRVARSLRGMRHVYVNDMYSRSTLAPLPIFKALTSLRTLTPHAALAPPIIPLLFPAFGHSTRSQTSPLAAFLPSPSLPLSIRFFLWRPWRPPARHPTLRSELCYPPRRVTLVSSTGSHRPA